MSTFASRPASPLVVSSSSRSLDHAGRSRAHRRLHAARPCLVVLGPARAVRGRFASLELESALVQKPKLSHGLHDVRRGRAARRLCRAAEQLLREERRGTVVRRLRRRVALLLRGRPLVVRRLRRRLSLLRGPSGAFLAAALAEGDAPQEALHFLERHVIGVAKDQRSPALGLLLKTHQLPTHERAAVPELYLQLLLLRPQGHHTLLATGVRNPGQGGSFGGRACAAHAVMEQLSTGHV
mmetsp:Transcript_22388/g.56972  ORF Transcript_22388/g.56972 Transcript_22388/m.56972 type:complete len:239 (+) Transcript_22388:276-992(+)